MDFIHIASIIFNLLALGIGYLIKGTFDSMKERLDKLEKAKAEQDKDITDIRIHYLHKDDFSEFKQDLWSRLDDIKESVKHG